MRKMGGIPLHKVCSWLNSFENICLTSLPKGIPKYMGFVVGNMPGMGNNAWLTHANLMQTDQKFRKTWELPHGRTINLE